MSIVWARQRKVSRRNTTESFIQASWATAYESLDEHLVRGQAAAASCVTYYVRTPTVLIPDSIALRQLNLSAGNTLSFLKNTFSSFNNAGLEHITKTNDEKKLMSTRQESVNLGY